MFVRNFLRIAAHLHLMPVLESGEETTLVGGQAVIEGVMMRTPQSYCVAVRRPDGEVVTETQPLSRLSEKYPLLRYPVLRGVATLGQAMTLGVKALKFSANAALEDAKAQGKGSAPAVSGSVMAANLLLSIGFFIFLYKFVPLYLTSALAKAAPVVEGRILFNLIDGLIRLGIFLCFLFLISRWNDIRRVFQYHGAEHRVVFNFESGQPVSVQNAQRFETWHPRCGTSFLIVVMLVSVGVYALLPFESFAGRLLARVVLLPVIAGLSYETIRFAARRRQSILAWLTAPGLWLQRITTQPPEDTQTEVAVIALEGALELEKAQGGRLVIA